MVELFVLEHLANSDHNIITWKTTCETVINKIFRKTFVFHKADYEKINEYFSNLSGKIYSKIEMQMNVG